MDFLVEHFPLIAGVLWIGSILVISILSYWAGRVRGELEAHKRDIEAWSKVDEVVRRSADK